MAIGTFGHEIIEMPINLASKQCNVSQASILVHGHFAPVASYTNEVWGMAIYANRERYATCSDDGKLKVWDTNSRKCIKTVDLNLDKTGKPIPMDPKWKDLTPAGQGRSIDVSPKGDFIAVGMRDGTLRVFQTSSWKMVHMQKCGNEWIEDLKFSPDGTKLAVGGHDNKLYIFSMPDCKPVVKKFGASSSFITHLDWSIDSQSIRTNDGSYELLYYNAADGTQIKAGATMFRDEPWATNSCVLGWAVQGIWQSGMDFTDVNHADRSHRPIVDDMQLIATGDDRGKVNLFRYPCMIEKSTPLQGQAHSSHVTKVRFSPKDNFLFSAGGNDTAIMQWKVVPQ
jgi:WD40 repeat protein